METTWSKELLLQWLLESILFLGQNVQKCVVYDILTQGLDDEECETEQCSTCNFEGEVYFKLKGICNTSTIIDTDYSMKFYSSTQEKFYFRGFLGLTKIVYSKIDKGWIIEDYNLQNTKRIIGIFNETTTPIGLHNWSMFTDCEIERKNPKNVQLKLTKVFFLQF